MRAAARFAAALAGETAGVHRLSVELFGSLALRGDDRHVVSPDQVIATMRQTGLDMSRRYKETSQGGRAVSVPDS
jgi:hypothetical protein